MGTPPPHARSPPSLQEHYAKTKQGEVTFREHRDSNGMLTWTCLNLRGAGRREKHCYCRDYDAPSITCGLKDECLHPGVQRAALHWNETEPYDEVSAEVLGCIKCLAVGLLHHAPPVLYIFEEAASPLGAVATPCTLRAMAGLAALEERATARVGLRQKVWAAISTCLLMVNSLDCVRIVVSKLR